MKESNNVFDFNNKDEFKRDNPFENKPMSHLITGLVYNYYKELVIEKKQPIEEMLALMTMSLWTTMTTQEKINKTINHQLRLVNETYGTKLAVTNVIGLTLSIPDHFSAKLRDIMNNAILEAEERKEDK